MAIQYEEAVDTLAAMFESWDRDLLIAIFTENGYHLERTIEMILKMDGEGTEGGMEGDFSPQESAPPQSLEDFLSDDVAPARSNNSNNNKKKAQVSSGRPGRRGIEVQLPSDFLKPPGAKAGNVDANTLGDEQLALMLQDELFRKEVLEVYGSDLSGIELGGVRRRSDVGHSSSRASSSSTAPLVPDMGILKGIQGLGEEMKKSLNTFALNFNNKKENERGYSEQDIHSTENSPLVNYEEEDDDEEESCMLNQRQGELTKRSTASKTTSPAANYGGKKDK